MMEEKNFAFVSAAAMLDTFQYAEVEKLRQYIRDIKSRETELEEDMTWEEISAPLSGKNAFMGDLRQDGEGAAAGADLSQSSHRDGNAVRVPRVVA